MSKLLKLADNYKSDKGSSTGSGTHFALLYEHFFGHLKDEKIKILEIGLNNGGPEHGSDRFNRVITDCPSIKMWHSYFSNGDIWGWDINDIDIELLKSMERFKFFKGDQGDVNSYKNFESLTNSVYSGDNLFDIIIDDGSHAFYHQQLSFVHLSKMLKPGGYYVIEDTHWQPDRTQGGSKLGGHAPFDKEKLPSTVNTRKLFDSIFIGKDHGTLVPNYGINEALRAPASEDMFLSCKPESKTPHFGTNSDFKSLDQFNNMRNHLDTLNQKRPEYASELFNEMKLYDRILLNDRTLGRDLQRKAFVLKIIILKKRD